MIILWDDCERNCKIFDSPEVLDGDFSQYLKAIGISEEEQENYKKQDEEKTQKKRKKRKKKTLESFMED